MANYSDNFDRASLGANWTAINGGTWATVSSTYLQQSAAIGTYRGLRYTSVLDSDNVDVSVRCYSTASSTGVGILVRAPNSGTATADLDGYALVFFPNDAFYIVRLDGGDDGGIGYGNTWGTPSTNTYYTLRIVTSGSTITGYIDGTQRFQITDTTYSGSGNRSVVLLSYANTPRYDDFAAFDVVSSQEITANLYTNTNTFYTPTVENAGSGSQTVQANLLSNSNTFYSPTLTINQVIQPNIVNPNRYSLRFNGNGADVNRVRIPLEDGSTTQYPINVGAGSFTVETWIKAQYSENTTTATSSDARYSNIIYDRDSWGEQRGHVIGVTRSGSNLVACFGQAGSSGNWATIFTTSNIGDNNWHHIAVTRNISTGVVRIFVDGVQEASGIYDTTNWSYPAGHTVSSGQDNQNLILGCEKHDVGYYFFGELDELRVSNSAIYSSTFSPSRYLVVDGSTVGLYRFDDGSGTTTIDSAGNTNGTLLVGGSPSGPVWTQLESVTSTVFPVTISSAVNVTTNAINSSSQIFNPTFLRGSVSIQANRIESNSQVNNVTINPGSVSVVLDNISSSAQVFEPTTSVGVTNIYPELLDNSEQLFNPIFQNGFVAERLESSTQFYSVTIQVGSVTLLPENISSNNEIFEPIVSSGATVIQANGVESNSQTYQPQIGLNINTTRLESSNTFFAPKLDLNVTSSNISSQEQVFEILIGGGVIASRIESGAQVFPVSIVSDSNVQIDIIENQEQVFNPKIDLNVSPSYVNNSNTFFDVELQNNVVIDTINSSSAIYAPNVSTGIVYVTIDRVESVSSVFEPYVFVGDEISVSLNLLSNNSTIFSPTLNDIIKKRIVRIVGQSREITTNGERTIIVY